LTREQVGPIVFFAFGVTVIASTTYGAKEAEEVRA